MESASHSFLVSEWPFLDCRDYINNFYFRLLQENDRPEKEIPAPDCKHRHWGLERGIAELQQARREPRAAPPLRRQRRQVP